MDSGETYLQIFKRYDKLLINGSDKKRNDIFGYTDADWASDIDDLRLLNGYVFLKNGTAISWASKIKSTVALFTTGSVYMAISLTVQKALWLRKLSEEIGQ